jgi:hypothetical protein
VNNKVNIEELTYDNFNLIKTKMGLAGLNVNLEVFPSINPITNHATLNLNEIDLYKENNLPLNEYIFIINNINMIYNISFNLFHRTL